MRHLSRFVLVSGASETTGDISNGHVVANDGATILVLRNTTSGSPTVRIESSVGFDRDLTAGPRIYTLPGSVTSYTGTFPVELYGPQLLIDVDSSAVRIVALSMAGS